MSIDPVRRLGLDVLIRFEDGGQLDALLEQARSELPRGANEARDAAFLSELVRGTVQWRARYDFLLSQFSRQGLPKERRLLCLLRMSLHQLLAMDKVPSYAAVDQAARLCRRRIAAGKVGYVNGLLQAIRRRFVPEGDDPAPGTEAATSVRKTERLEAFFAERIADPVVRLATWSSHPHWLVSRWVERYGAEQAAAICVADNTPAPLFFHVLDPHRVEAVAAELAAAGCPVEPGGQAGCLVAQQRCGRQVLAAALERLPDVIVQNRTVQAATAWLLGGTEAPTGPVLDMCAAPGGKTAVLARRWSAEAPVLAMDNRRSRLDLLRDTVARTCSDRVVVLAGDGQQPPLRPGSCAAVLLDGPCSGTGVLGHHPDGRWWLRPQIPVENGERLLALAERAVDLLAPAGLLLYATCSLEPEENQDVLAALLRRRSDLEPAPWSASDLAPDLAPGPEVTDMNTAEEAAWQRCWFPTVDGGDGFFAARLRKRG